MNPYQVGIGGFVITSLYVIVLAFLWRALAARFTASDNDRLVNIGAAMGSSI